MPFAFDRPSSVGPTTRQAHTQRGLTLIELMTTIAVLGVLMAIAAPSFNPMMDRYRVRQATEELQASLYYARSEAIKNSGGISVVPNSGSWDQGWEIKNSTETLRQTDAPNKTNISLAGDQGGVDLDRWGMLMHKNAGAPATLTFTIQTAGSSNVCQKLVIESSGSLKQHKTCS